MKNVQARSTEKINFDIKTRNVDCNCKEMEMECRRNCKEMSSMVQEIETSLDGLSEHVHTLDNRVDEQSNEIKTCLTALENRLGGIENRFKGVEDGFKEMENRFEKVENQLLQMEDLRFKDGQHGAERDERENSRSDQACAAESSNGMEDTKQANQYAYLVAGGYGKDVKPLSSAEVFDKTSNSWIPLKPMKTCRAESSSVVYNGQVFVTGGTSNGENILSSMEKFSSNVNPLVPPCWSYFPLNLPRALKGHYTVVYHDRMLVIGGYNEENKTCSDLVYEVQLQFPFNVKVLVNYLRNLCMAVVLFL